MSDRIVMVVCSLMVIVNALNDVVGALQLPRIVSILCSGSCTPQVEHTIRRLKALDP